MIWKAIRNKTRRRSSTKAISHKRRCIAEKLEERQLLAADPIHVGLVYIETDYLETDQDAGNDSQGDRFILSFTGGAPNTALQELRIDTDKYGDGLSIGDPMFDTEIGGRGKNGAHDFRLLKIDATPGRNPTVTATVADGGQELVLQFTNFMAGDRLEFTMDVDEVLRNSADLAVFNNALDVITSGQEFQDSILQATFNAPHYETASADAVFVNDFGSPGDVYGLDLPPDDGPDIDSRPNRSAAAVASTVQVPKPIEISGHVWLDNDLDLVREPGEQLLSGVELTLFRLNPSTGQYDATGHQTATNNDGFYSFGKSLGLAPGTYRVVESQPNGLLSVGAVTGQVAGTQTGQVESADILAGITIPFGDQTAVNYDFAEAQPANLSGFVYRDDNDNGLRETGEPGIGQIRVQLIPLQTISNQTSLITTTAADGSYSFTGIAPGNYQVVELDQPVDLEDGLDTAGTVDGQTVGAAQNPGDRIELISLYGGDSGIEYNFGEVPLGSLAGFVYLANPGEDCTGEHGLDVARPLSGVTVELWTPGGDLIVTTTTASNGGYLFDDLRKGTYVIREITPVGLIDGGSHVGRIATVEVGTSSPGMIAGILLTAGAVGTEYNFCEAAPASISGYVYHDESNDGIRDAGEAPIPSTTLQLRDAAGAVVATTQTDGSGYYEFTKIDPGEYSVFETQPAGFFDGKDTPGRVQGIAAGRRGTDGDSLIDIELKQGTNGVEYNFGELQSASISGHVHVDVDEDCIQDPGEISLAGVVIRLLDQSGTEIAQTTTDANGDYRFDNLAPGSYSVIEETPAGYFEGGSMPGDGGGNSDGPNRIINLELQSGDDAQNNDFCERPPAEISGVVFADHNQNCIQESTEFGLSGVVVELYDSAGNLVDTTQTDSSGAYEFTNLPAGGYTVRELQPVGWLHGGQMAGSHGGDDSAADVISSVAIGWGDRLTQYNFCEIEPSKISGFVWQETDLDRVFDADESPIPNVKVELVDASGNVVDVTTTDADGQYCFENLRPGEYSVREYQPEGLFHGGQVPGSVGGDVGGDDLIVRIPITPGTTAVQYNFPEVPPASISGFVFQDGAAITIAAAPDPSELRNFRDGELTPDDTRLTGVVLELRNVLGQPVVSTRALPGVYDAGSIQVMTDANGFYEFTGLRPGTYHVYQVQPDDYIDSLDTPGTTGGLAVNQADVVNNTGKIVIQTLAANDATDPKFDAILNIDLAAGGSSDLNNFSEIIIDPVRPPEDDPPPPNPPAYSPIETFDPRVLLIADPVDAYLLPPPPLVDEWAVTWHLSVINGGYPRGSIGTPDLGIIRSVGMRLNEQHGDPERLNLGSWTITGRDGAPTDLGDTIQLGSRYGTALTGDFDGDGSEEAAIYSAGQWFVDLNGNGHWDNGDLWIRLGTELDRPVVGDWDGDGKDDIGIFGRQWYHDPIRVKHDPGLPDPANQRRREMNAAAASQTRFVGNRADAKESDQERVLRRGNQGTLRADAVDHVFQYGEHADTPLAGDWNGDGIDQIAVFRDGQWMLDVNGDGRWTPQDGSIAEFGRPGDEPVVGDFNGDGIDEIMVVRGDLWIIDTDGDGKLTGNDTEVVVPRESGDSQPVAGDFDGDGKVELGYYKDAS